MVSDKAKVDHGIILGLIEPESRVLDLGCGDGELLQELASRKKAVVQGIELSQESILKCVEKGINVFHSDVDSGLKDYPDRSFDYVILNQSLQEVKNIQYVMNEALRVGKKVVVGFPNFAYLKSRVMLAVVGQAPITSALPYKWYNTPNLHFWSIKDFRDFCAEKKIKVLKEYFYGEKSAVSIFPNLLAQNAIFVLAAPGL